MTYTITIIKHRFRELTEYIYGPERVCPAGLIEILEKEGQGDYLNRLNRVATDLYDRDGDLVRCAIDDVLTKRRRRTFYA